MSNKTRLQTNNTNLQALIDKANALPEAGSGGSASVETCTVTIDDNDCGAFDWAYLTVYRNNVCSVIQTPPFEEESHTITDVVCNSCIVVTGAMGMPSDVISTSNITLLLQTNSALILQAPASSGEGVLRLEL